jgi:hypothetical protein
VSAHCLTYVIVIQEQPDTWLHAMPPLELLNRDQALIIGGPRVSEGGDTCQRIVNDLSSKSLKLPGRKDLGLNLFMGRHGYHSCCRR